MGTLRGLPKFRPSTNPATAAVFGLLRSAVAWLVELQDPIACVGLIQVLRSKAGRRVDRDEMLWRIARLRGEMALRTRLRQSAFSEIFGAFTPAGFVFRADGTYCRATSRQGGVLAIGGELYWRGQIAATLNRRLFFGAGIAGHDLLRIEEPFRDAGLAVVVLARSFQLYDNIGLRKVLLQASLTTGRWYWARCGFDFLTDEDRRRVHAFVQYVLDALGVSIDTRGFTSAEQFALIGKAQGMTTSLEAIATAVGSSQFREELEKDIAPGNGIEMTDLIDLGRALMISGPSWNGVLDLQGPGRTAFEAYAQGRLRKLATLGVASQQ